MISKQPLEITVEITSQVEDEVLQTYRRLRSPYKVARELGYGPSIVWEIIERNQDTAALPTQRYDGNGRPDMEQFLVKRMKVTAEGWNNEDEAVAGARARFCAGTHTMTTGRDGPWLLLYSIPLKKPIEARPDYFKMRSY